MTDTNAFWRFSLDRYRRKGVAELCLEAQSRHGADVNLVLFGLWLGHNGRRLSPGGLLQARDSVSGWHEEVVRSLRRARSWMKTCGIGEDSPREALREEIKRLEIEAERQEQALLFTLWQRDEAAGGGLFPPGAEAGQAMAENAALLLDAGHGPAEDGQSLAERLARLCL